MKCEFVIFAAFAVLVPNLLVVKAEAQDETSVPFKTGTNIIYDRIVTILESAIDGANFYESYSPINDDKILVGADFEGGVVAILSIVPDVAADAIEEFKPILTAFVASVFNAIYETKYDGFNWTYIEPLIESYEKSSHDKIVNFVNKLVDVIGSGKDYSADVKEEIESLRENLIKDAEKYHSSIWNQIWITADVGFLGSYRSTPEIVNAALQTKIEAQLTLDNFLANLTVLLQLVRNN